MAGLSYFNNTTIKDFSRLGRVWNLFSNFGFREQQAILEESRRGDAMRYDFSTDLISAASKGARYLDEDYFNLAGYDYRVRNFKRIGKVKELSEVAYIVTDGEIEARGRIGYGEVSERNLESTTIIDDVDSVTNNLDYEGYWISFPRLIKDSLDMGYDLPELMFDAILGNEDSITYLSILASEYEKVSEFLEGVFIRDKFDDVMERVRAYL